VAERDPDVIKQEIAEARDRLASTVDILAERANPQRVADDLRATALGFLNQPKVKAALAGLGALTVVMVIRGIRR
jgi:hypothetical protein